MRDETKRSTTTTRTAPLESGPESLRAAKDEIRTRAYELFMERYREPGHADDDRFRAELEIRTDKKTVSLEGPVGTPGPEAAR